MYHLYVPPRDPVPEPELGSEQRAGTSYPPYRPEPSRSLRMPSTPSPPAGSSLRHQDQRRHSAGFAVSVVAACAGVAASLMILVGASDGSADQEQREHQAWDECIAEERADLGDDSFLEPEDLCSIRFPSYEEKYGEQGGSGSLVDDDDPSSLFDDDESVGWDDGDDSDW